MKILAGLAVVAVIALGAGAVWYFEPWDDGDDEVDLAALTEEFQGSSCRQTAGLAAGLALQDPELTPIEFLRAFGRQVAGIRPPPRAYGDLARGGSNQVPGKGSSPATTTARSARLATSPGSRSRPHSEAGRRRG